MRLRAPPLHQLRGSTATAHSNGTANAGHATSASQPALRDLYLCVSGSSVGVAPLPLAIASTAQRGAWAGLLVETTGGGPVCAQVPHRLPSLPMHAFPVVM